MGNKASIKHTQKFIQTTRLTIPARPQESHPSQSSWEQYVQVSQCCGIRQQKRSRRKIIWQNNFIRYCQSIMGQFQWAKDMIQLVNGCELPKNKYFQEINNLKNEMKVEQPAATENLHTKQQVQNFKTNLKRSVVLSFGRSQISKKSQSLHRLSNSIGLIKNQNPIRIDKRLNHFSNKQINNNFIVEKTKSISSYGFRSSILSLIEDTISSALGQQKQITKKSAKQLQIFLKFSMILQAHMNDLNCMLGRIKRLFILYIQKTYRDPIKASLNINNLVDNVKQFLALLKQATYDYYNLQSYGDQSEYSNSFIANQQNILSACTALVFKDTTFYNVVFDAVKAHCKARQDQFIILIECLKHSTPQFFHIKPNFCLNAGTIKHYIQNMGGDSTDDVVQNIQFNDMIINNQQPYKNCMNYMQQLIKSKSPINKMKAIMACSDSITEEITRFYDLNGLRKQKWMLDADQVLSIFCYIITHAKIQNLHSHLFILDNFATSHQMISVTGYYLSVITCAVEQLQHQYVKKIHNSQL